jgi:hypothetical protein
MKNNSGIQQIQRFLEALRGTNGIATCWSSKFQSLAEYPMMTETEVPLWWKHTAQFGPHLTYKLLNTSSPGIKSKNQNKNDVSHFFQFTEEA